MMTKLQLQLPFEDGLRCTQGFGENPSSYARFGLPGHNGIDWSAVVGTRIVTVDSGTVMRIAEDPGGFGQYVKIKHSWGESLYAHLSQIMVSLDQEVIAGDVLALSGNTGNSTGPHLHFGIRVNPYNKADGWYGYTNPQRYLDWTDAGYRMDLTEKRRLQQVDSELQETTQKLEELRGAFAFERQELVQQAELWRQTVRELITRYLPGRIPEDSDELAVLESMIQNWAEELKQQRTATIAGIFGPKTSR